MGRTPPSSHRFDKGQAWLVLRALALLSGHPQPRSASERRNLWEKANVIVDDLSCDVLVLGLAPAAGGKLAEGLRAFVAEGEPVRLTLRQLRRARSSFPCSREGPAREPKSQDRDYICGNLGSEATETRILEAVYEDGVLRPLEDPGLQEHQRVLLEIRFEPGEAASSQLEAWHQVYEGLSDDEVAEVESMALARSRFSLDKP